MDRSSIPGFRNWKIVLDSEIRKSESGDCNPYSPVRYVTDVVQKQFWATVCKTVRPMLSPYVVLYVYPALSCPVCL